MRNRSETRAAVHRFLTFPGESVVAIDEIRILGDRPRRARALVGDGLLRRARVQPAGGLQVTDHLTFTGMAGEAILLGLGAITYPPLQYTVTSSTATKLDIYNKRRHEDVRQGQFCNPSTSRLPTKLTL